MSDSDGAASQEVAQLRERIAELEQQQRKLLEDHNLLSQLLRTLPDRVYFKDRDSRFARVSSALATMHGLDDPADLVGLSDAELFTDEHAQQAREDELRLMAGGSTDRWARRTGDLE